MTYVRTLAALVCAWLCFPAALFAQDVQLGYDKSNPQLVYAAERIASALKKIGRPLTDSGDPAAFTITLNVDKDALPPEAFAFEPGERALTITAGDGRGAIYGAFALVEDLRAKITLEQVAARREEAALALRAIKFNLPWDSYRSSSALDLHYDTVRDPRYWEAFLDMMAENRFNALTLWNLHPFPYMIRAHNFPEASRFSDAELAEWQALYRAIFAMAKQRGIETYLVNWNILVSPEFAAHHGLEGQPHYPFYKGTDRAATEEVVKRYTRESVTQVLEEYPDLTGLGFSLGEQMAGMTPQERQDWIDETFIAGMQEADRPSKMIFRAPFSADLGQGGSTDAATERLTRKAIEVLPETGEPVWLEIKFNWSHGFSTTDLVKVHGGPLDDSYFTPAPSNYRVAWMMRNEDFYVLRWGSPTFVRDHILRNSDDAYVGGYFVGSENYIPAVDYFTADAMPRNWTYAFERQWLFYRLWGRLLYDPQTPDSVFTADFVRRYGMSAAGLLGAWEHASQIQLHFATSIDFAWDFTIYGEGMMVLGRDGLQPMSVERLIEQPPLPRDWLSVRDFVARRSRGDDAVGAGVVTPLMLADRLEADARAALDGIEGLDAREDPALLYELADIRAWSGLGRYYAEKLRGAVALQTFRTTGQQSEREAAISHLTRSLAHWDEVIAITRPIYKASPLAHFNPPNNGRTEANLFHWARLRERIAADIDVARKANAPQSAN